MTASNHVLAGAVIAVGVNNPVLALPLAFLSHFVLDAIPHFGVHKGDPIARNKHGLFRFVLTIDVLYALTLAIALPLLLRDFVAYWVVAGAMLLAWLPDGLWTLSFYYEVRHGRVLPKRGRLQQFHAQIQKESVPGLAVEVVCAMALIIVVALVMS